MCECNPWIGPVIVGAFFGGPLLAGLILHRLTTNAYRVLEADCSNSVPAGSSLLPERMIRRG